MATSATKEAALAFRPINTRNAVLEGIAVLLLSRPLIASESAAIRSAHKTLSLDLPRLEDVPGMTMFVGVGPPPSEVPPTPFSMSAYQRDGAVEARLLVNPQLLTANFLVYTHWEEHWGKCLLWFRAAMEAVKSASNGLSTSPPPVQIAAIGHQMVDVFPWEGDPSMVSAALILQENNDRLPRLGVRSVGETWGGTHTSMSKRAAQGIDQPEVNLIDRLICDLGEETPLGWRLRLDHLQEMRFPTPQDPGTFLNDDGSLASRLMGELHDRNRSLVQSLLSDNMLVSIGLRAT